MWKEPLLPGAYYFNRHAYDMTPVDTRVQTWEYKGGYKRRTIDLSIDQQGQLTQTEHSTDEPMPATAVDRAVFVKVEGWDIPQELRVVAQVSPENAPIVTGSVGGIQEIEHRILTPLIRSIVRNVAGSNIRVPKKEGDKIVGYEERPTRVLDLIENREAIEDTIEEVIRREARKAGVEIREIRLGEPAIPPEILVARLRVQLADQLGLAYLRETEAQKKRIETEQARATANEQPRLVESQIAVKVAEQRENERAALGRAERKYLEEIAQGQTRPGRSARPGSRCHAASARQGHEFAGAPTPAWWRLSANSCRAQSSTARDLRARRQFSAMRWADRRRKTARSRRDQG